MALDVRRKGNVNSPDMRPSEDGVGETTSENFGDSKAAIVVASRKISEGAISDTGVSSIAISSEVDCGRDILLLRIEHGLCACGDGKVDKNIT